MTHLQAPHTPDIRVCACNDLDILSDRSFVLYWMIAQRRPHYNFALQYAAEQAKALDLPLLIFEPLRTGYPWASDRLHRFIMDGMRDNAHHFKDSAALYYPYLERTEDAGKGLLKALAKHAALVVTDDFPSFFIPSMIQAAAEKIDARLVQVDSNGLLPLRAAPKVYTTAYSFRRGLHKLLPDHLAEGFPMADPLEEINLKPWPKDTTQTIKNIQQKWNPAPSDMLNNRDKATLADLPIDHEVTIAPVEGGHVAATTRMHLFLDEKLSAYPDDRNKPSEDGASSLSPYLHFGHISSHEVFAQLCKNESWSPDKIAQKPTGKREGWWNMSAGAEAFLDELITWREIGYNIAHKEPTKYSSFEALPDFAKKTLREHADDKRPYIYTLEEFEEAQTHDKIWNAAQNQLVQTGQMHNYMRMLWGKKILEWTESPEQAAEVMIELNNKYALDGRNPNSYSGIFWCLGRYDRGWAERDVFGKIRYMTSKSTASKYDLSSYLRKYC